MNTEPVIYVTIVHLFQIFFDIPRALVEPDHWHQFGANWSRNGHAIEDEKKNRDYRIASEEKNARIEKSREFEH